MAQQDITDAVDLAHRLAVAAVDTRSTRIWAVDDPGSRPAVVRDADPDVLRSNRYHRRGAAGAEEADYWRTVGRALAPASAVLLLGHGGGKANASHLLVAWLEQHMPEVAARIVADVRADIDDLTDAEVLRIGQHYFHEAPPRLFVPRTR